MNDRTTEPAASTWMTQNETADRQTQHRCANILWLWCTQYLQPQHVARRVWRWSEMCGSSVAEWILVIYDFSDWTWMDNIVTEICNFHLVGNKKCCILQNYNVTTPLLTYYIILLVYCNIFVRIVTVRHTRRHNMALDISIFSKHILCSQPQLNVTDVFLCVPFPTTTMSHRTHNVTNIMCACFFLLTRQASRVCGVCMQVTWHVRFSAWFNIITKFNCTN